MLKLSLLMLKLSLLMLKLSLFIPDDCRDVLAERLYEELRVKFCTNFAHEPETHPKQSTAPASRVKWVDARNPEVGKSHLS